MSVFTASALRNRLTARRPMGLMSYVALYRQRRALAEMDDSRLADLGLSRHEADAEAKRPIWDAPNHWK